MKVEGATQTETKYYSGPTGRFAMRVEEVLYWLFSDHLNSTSVITDNDEALLCNAFVEFEQSSNSRSKSESFSYVNRTDYTAFGEVRFTTGSNPTDYTYSGQRYEEEVGLSYYVARWFDPVLGHFIQADSLIPQPGNAGDWDRYAYVLGNPVRYNDPSGHTLEQPPNNDPLLDGEMTPQEVDLSLLLNEIQARFGWGIDNVYSESLLKEILSAGNIMSNYINANTPVDGDAWISKNLGNAVFNQHPQFLCQNYNCVYPTHTIWLNSASVSTGTISHELAHVFDNNSNSQSVLPATFFGGGISDMLIEFVGISPHGLRFTNKWEPGGMGDTGYWFYKALDSKNLLIVDTSTGSQTVYGNFGQADYFADSWQYIFTNNSTKIVPEVIRLYLNSIITLTSP
ncbi:MAG: RHS repeat-associated core domain-containing protein [Anaerolineae bacterium]|nr:RHS repeat-associated core domain-containing protein [Anaerolineae bacterium]